MTEAVRTHILRRMTALYPPPQHLRGSASKQTAALTAYETALSGFDEATLAAGWALVTAEHAFWVWPNPGQVADACRRCAPPPPAVSDQERRRAEAFEMADAYTAHFMKSTQVARMAEKEGWAGRLRSHVHDHAAAQAQIICGVERVAFASSIIPEEHRHLSAREGFAAYRESVAGPVERGRVRVAVPAARVREWKAAAVVARPDPRGNGTGRC